ILMEVIIRPDDSFWYYSELFDIPVILIEQSNPQLNPEQLMTGQVVRIPGYMEGFYQIAAGENLWDIAMERNLPVDMLELANPDIEPQNLQDGPQLTIPERVNNLMITDFNHYTSDKMVRDIGRLLTIYPFIFQKTIGSSVMGKDI